MSKATPRSLAKATIADRSLQPRDPGSSNSKRAALGKADRHRRAVDTLERLRLAGVITDAMLEAGRRFERNFALAGLEPLRAASLHRVIGGGTLSANSGEQRLRARRRLHHQITMLGGIDSPAGCCAWAVLGEGRSLRGWSLGQGWRGRPLRQEQALGILVGTLGVLAGGHLTSIVALDDDGQNR